ncbi:MAG: helix-turn-helix transcriptional regulator [Chloroflexia bacterium]|nr:helix-turn-helix transcriptional regulator [Chloroflexia bacterium]
MDDQVISQTDVIQHEAGQVVGDAGHAPREVDFAHQLKRLRDERAWSKADLAKRSELDPSSITRFEQGSRNPDRDTIFQISDAMALPLVERDRLLAAAGYRSEIWDEPLLVELSQILADREIPLAIRDEMRSVLRMAIAYGRLKRLEAR